MLGFRFAFFRLPGCDRAVSELLSNPGPVGMIQSLVQIDRMLEGRAGPGGVASGQAISEHLPPAGLPEGKADLLRERDLTPGVCLGPLVIAREQQDLGQVVLGQAGNVGVTELLSDRQRTVERLLGLTEATKLAIDGAE